MRSNRSDVLTSVWAFYFSLGTECYRLYVRSSMGLNIGLRGASLMLSTLMSIHVSIWIVGGRS